MINPLVADRIKQHLKKHHGANFDDKTFEIVSKMLKPSLCNMLAYRLDFYEMLAKTNYTRTHCIHEVADRYDVSDDSVKNAVYRKDLKWLDKVGVS